MARFNSSEICTLAEPGKPDGLRSSYRVADTGGQVVCESRVISPSRDSQSRSIFDARRLHLREHETVSRTSGGLHVVHVSIRGDEASVFNRIGRHSWHEVIRLREGAALVPFVPFSYAELVYLLRFVDWNDKSHQLFPMLHVMFGADFSYRGFYYALQIRSETPSQVEVRCANISKVLLGSQVEPYEINVDRQTQRIFHLRALARGWEISASSSAATRTTFRPHRRKVLPRVPRVRWSRVGSVTRPVAIQTLRQLGRTKMSVWLFDLVRFNEHVRGTQAVRQDLSSIFLRRGISLVVFDELLANTAIGTRKVVDGKSGMRHEDLCKSLRSLWGKLRRADVPKPAAILALEENCVLAAAALAEVADRPPLVLMSPFWGDAAGWRLEFHKGSPSSDEDRSILELLGDKRLTDLLRMYGRPTFAAGKTPPPSDIAGQVRYWKTPDSGFERFWFPPRPSHHLVVDRMAAWLRRLGNVR